MSRYYTLVVVPGDANAPEEACEVAAELLYPYMYNHDEPTRGHNFDSMYSPEDIADLTDDDILLERTLVLLARYGTRSGWRASPTSTKQFCTLYLLFCSSPQPNQCLFNLSVTAEHMHFRDAPRFRSRHYC